MTELELLEKMKDYPNLRDHFEHLISIIENTEGKIQLADDAEKRVIEEMRLLGRDTLQGWTTYQSKRTSEYMLQREKKLRKHLKKTHVVYHLRNYRSYRADFL